MSMPNPSTPTPLYEYPLDLGELPNYRNGATGNGHRSHLANPIYMIVTLVGSERDLRTVLAAFRQPSEAGLA